MYLVQWMILVPVYDIRLKKKEKQEELCHTYFECTGKVVFYFEVKAFVHVAT
jgi:hypothetical protein